VPELSLESLEITDRDDKRMLDSLKFRLGFKIREMDIISILHRRGTWDKAEDFLKQFQKEAGTLRRGSQSNENDDNTDNDEDDK
jgi:hypothetical protein